MKKNHVGIVGTGIYLPGGRMSAAQICEIKSNSSFMDVFGRSMPAPWPSRVPLSRKPGPAMLDMFDRIIYLSAQSHRL